MKILYHHRIRSKDGQYVHVAELTRALENAGHELIFVGPRAIQTKEFGTDGGMAARLKSWLPGWIYELLEMSYSLFDFVRMAIVICGRRPDCIYERYNLFLPSGIWASKIFDLPLLLEVNAPLFAERSRYSGISLNKLAASVERYTWRGAAMVLPVTEVLASIVETAGVPRERVVVIPNGIDPDRFASVPNRNAAKAALGLEDTFVLGFSGFVREWHRIDRVLEYLAESERKDQHLLLVGDGPAADGLIAMAGRFGIADKFSITGIVGRERVGEYLAAFDLALQPSVVDYASPLKLIEYLAMGHAIVAPNARNLREILKDGENSLLFEPDSDASLISCIERARDNDALRNRLGRSARKTIAARSLTWENNAKRICQIYAELGIQVQVPKIRAQRIN